MSNSIGKLFTITSFGESHGHCVGVVIDGCPAGLAITDGDIQKELDRRKPATDTASTRRVEEDKVEVLSGIFKGKTTGAPICLAVWNRDVRSDWYEKTRFLPRPGHADFPAYMKYGGLSDYRGGGRFSGRITAGFVMAGAVARKLLDIIGIEILAHTVQVGEIKAKAQKIDEIRENIGKNSLRCADLDVLGNMNELISKTKAEGDSVGGIAEGIALNVPVGLGEPVFDNLDGELAKALFAIPAVKGVEFGAGFEMASMRGSQSNDPFIKEGDKIVTLTNNAGGVLGGISSGMPVAVRVAIKPTASITKEQKTVDVQDAEKITIEIEGRHDVCIVPRAVPVVESMMAVTLCDLALREGLLPRVIK